MRFIAIFLLYLFALATSLASAKIYFQEGFDAGWEKRWVVSTAKPNLGKWAVSAGDWYGDEEADQGLMTTQDARFYDISAEFDTEFANKDKDMVVQFSVKHQQEIDCGGGYVKIHKSLNQEALDGDSDYNIMFGPDICGATNRKVHVILNYNGKNHLINKNIACEHDDLTHVYTLILRSDQTYEVRVDGETREAGNLIEDWDFLAPKMVPDYTQTKPADWVDDELIDDPLDTKPSDWDDIPETIVDPEAEKPDDWDDEVDGEWDAPMIDNPDYQGEWKPKMILNPAYKGEWEQPMKENDEYAEDKEIYAFESNFISFDLWQVKSGTIFDNIIVTDNVKDAEDLLENTWALISEEELAMRDEVLEERARDMDQEWTNEDDDEDDDDEDDDDEEEEEMHDEL